MGCCASTHASSHVALSPAVAAEIDAHVQMTIRSSESLRLAVPLLIRLRRKQHPSETTSAEAFITIIRGDEIAFSALPGAQGALRLSHQSMRSHCEALRREARCTENCSAKAAARFTAWCGAFGDERVLKAIDAKFDVELQRVLIEAVEERDAAAKASVAAPSSNLSASAESTVAAPAPAVVAVGSLPFPPPEKEVAVESAAPVADYLRAAEPVVTSAEVVLEPVVSAPSSARSRSTGAATSPRDSDRGDHQDIPTTSLHQVPPLIVTTAPTDSLPPANDGAPPAASPAASAASAPPNLPPGDWKPCAQNPRFYYCKAEDLFFHLESGLLYDSQSEMWWDGERWIPE